MTPSFEGLLALGIVGFYLWDSAMLLHRNEMIFTQSGGNWAFACPDVRWHLLGKILHLPNPFSPHRLLFRVAWTLVPDEEQHDGDQDLERFASAVEPLQAMVLVLYWLLIVGLPLALLAFGSGARLLAAFAAVYLVISGILTFIFLRREQLGLPGKDFLKLAFDSLACPPFAVNLVRKLAERRFLGPDPIEFACRAFDEATFARFAKVLCSRLDEELECECEASARFTALKALRARVASMAP